MLPRIFQVLILAQQSFRIVPVPVFDRRQASNALEYRPERFQIVVTNVVSNIGDV